MTLRILAARHLKDNSVVQFTISQHGVRYTLESHCQDAGLVHYR